MLVASYESTERVATEPGASSLVQSHRSGLKGELGNCPCSGTSLCTPMNGTESETIWTMSLSDFLPGLLVPISCTE